MSYKLTIISIALMVLTLTLSVFFNNSPIIKHLLWLSGLLFFVNTFIIVPIIEYAKSKEKKIIDLICPILCIIPMMVFLLFSHNERIMVFCMWMLILLIIITDILKKKKITLKNMIYMIALIVCIVVYIKFKNII